MEFPRLVFKDGGDTERHGGTYSSLLVDTATEHKIALEKGWYSGLLEAIEACKKPPIGVVLPAEDKPPTRAEIETKAKELSISFHPSIGDANLLRKIEDALKG